MAAQLFLLNLLELLALHFLQRGLFLSLFPFALPGRLLGLLDLPAQAQQGVALRRRAQSPVDVGLAFIQPPLLQALLRDIPIVGGDALDALDRGGVVGLQFQHAPIRAQRVAAGGRGEPTIVHLLLSVGE